MSIVIRRQQHIVMVIMNFHLEKGISSESCECCYFVEVVLCRWNVYRGCAGHFTPIHYHKQLNERVKSIEEKPNFPTAPFFLLFRFVGAIISSFITIICHSLLYVTLRYITSLLLPPHEQQRQYLKRKRK